MSDEITCPHCNHVSSISELELWEAYDCDGAENDIECGECEKEFRIYSTIVKWKFETGLIDD